MLGRKNEMIVEVWRRSDHSEPVFIDGESIRRVVIVSISVSIFNNTPSWKQSISALLKKVHFVSFAFGSWNLSVLNSSGRNCSIIPFYPVFWLSVSHPGVGIFSRRKEWVRDNIIRKTRGREHKTVLICWWTDKTEHHNEPRDLSTEKSVWRPTNLETGEGESTEGRNSKICKFICPSSCGPLEQKEKRSDWSCPHYAFCNHYAIVPFMPFYALFATLLCYMNFSVTVQIIIFSAEGIN